jgi:hypothetical protein
MAGWAAMPRMPGKKYPLSRVPVAARRPVEEARRAVATGSLHNLAPTNLGHCACCGMQMQPSGANKWPETLLSGPGRSL